MPFLITWLHIFGGVAVYIVFALAASWIIRRSGHHLKDMTDRSSQAVYIIAGIINFLVLIATILLLVYWVGLPASSLGLAFTPQDLLVSTIGTGSTAGLAAAYIAWLGSTADHHVKLLRPKHDSGSGGNYLVGILVLFIVALQEEVLYRGYITLNMTAYAPLVIGAVSTIIFTAVHLLTNRASFYQILSWLIGGALLAYVYLASGSIWVPVIIHFAMDLTNVLIFNITETASLFKIDPALTNRQRAAYRAASALVLIAMVLAVYGPTLAMG